MDNQLQCMEQLHLQYIMVIVSFDSYQFTFGSSLDVLPPSSSLVDVQGLLHDGRILEKRQRFGLMLEIFQGYPLEIS